MSQMQVPDDPKEVVIGLDGARERLADAGIVQAAFDIVTARILSRDGVGLALTGSFAEATADRHSDLDLLVLIPDGSPPNDDYRWLAEIVESYGNSISSFAATHLGLANVLVFFQLVGEDIVKIDLTVEHGSHSSGTGKGMLIRPPGLTAAPLAHVAPSTALEVTWSDLRNDTYRKFVGWIWYTYTKIARGELLEAHDSLAVMRRNAIIPALQELFGLPREGARRLEQRLPANETRRLVEIVPIGTDREALLRALLTMATLFTDLQQRLVLACGQDFRTGNMAAVLAAIARSEAASH